jgi:rRNA pseudouridine-1189 N-methylase Emg1 (Nep1/Mra1 family)
LYLSGLQCLTEAEARNVDIVTIVGTKYCPGAFEYLIAASRIREPSEQCLYLVKDVKSNEVMLHNGEQCLGLVAKGETSRVHDVLARLAKTYGVDHVLVCKLRHIGISDENTFRWNTSFNVQVWQSVNERLARKFSDKYRKGV